MLDIGWGELLVIGVVALIVVGPKDLPGLFRTAGQFMGKARGMAREFQRSMEAAADETGLNEASNSLKRIDRLNLGSATGSARKYAEGLVKGDGAAGPKLPATPMAAGAAGPAKSAAAVADASATVSATASATAPAASPVEAETTAPARDPAST